jgi:hypothetical protein
VSDHNRVLQRGGDFQSVGDVIAQRHLANVAHGSAAVMAAQIHRVALVPALRQECLVFLPVPRAAEHPVDQQSGLPFGGKRGSYALKLISNLPKCASQRTGQREALT